MENEDMAGRIMAHAFWEELEKVATSKSNFKEVEKAEAHLAAQRALRAGETLWTGKRMLNPVVKRQIASYELGGLAALGAGGALSVVGVKKLLERRLGRSLPKGVWHRLAIVGALSGALRGRIVGNLVGRRRALKEKGISPGVFKSKMTPAARRKYITNFDKYKDSPERLAELLGRKASK
jgi:hypothetical protein